MVLHWCQIRQGGQIGRLSGDGRFAFDRRFYSPDDSAHTVGTYTQKELYIPCHNPGPVNRLNRKSVAGLPDPPTVRRFANNDTSMTNETTAGSRAKFTDPVPWIMLVLALSSDQITKWLTVENLARGESWPAEGFFRFTHAWNTGTAFSLFQGQGDILTWVSLGAVAVLAWIYRSIIDPPWVLRIAFGLQLGGAIGNLIDRFRLGHVTDFIDIGPWPIFNIADSSIVIGIGLMLFYFWFLEPDSNKKAGKTDDVQDEAATGEDQAASTAVTKPKLGTLE